MNRDLNYLSGDFTCPGCGYKALNRYTTWLSRTEYIKQSPQTKYIFYKDKNKCACCLCCFLRCNEDKDKSLYTWIVNCMKCKELSVNVVCFPCYLICIIFYLLICSIGDIFNLCCCRYEEYEDVCEYSVLKKEKEEKEKESKEKEEKEKEEKEPKENEEKEPNELNSNNDLRILSKSDNQLWTYCKGFSETEWKEFQMETKCQNCNYSSDTFMPFIETPKDKEAILITVEQRSPKTEERLIEDEKIAINIGLNNSGVYPVICKLSDKFISIEKQFFDKYPELKSKNYYFLGNGEKMKPNETLVSQNIKHGDTILFREE